MHVLGPLLEGLSVFCRWELQTRLSQNIHQLFRCVSLLMPHNECLVGLGLSGQLHLHLGFVWL